MRVKVRLFAAYREAAGNSQWDVEVGEGQSPLDLWHRLAEEHPRLLDFSHPLMAAINGEYASLDAPLHEGDEVAFIPPVSGGEPEGLFEVTKEEISVQRLVDAVRSEEAGAVVVFLGTARRHSRGREVEYLEYEAYPEMAEAKLREIGREIKERWGLDRVAMVQRIGRVDLGEASVGIAVAAPHRKEAFEAARYAIDRLKEMAPIWKKEVWEGGEEWVEE